MKYNFLIQSISLVIKLTFFLWLIYQPALVFAQSDTVDCDLRNITEAGPRLKISVPAKAQLGTEVKIQTEIGLPFSNFQEYGELRLCIRDSKTGQWSKKPANWVIRSFQRTYSYDWDTEKAQSNSSTSENPHKIRVIAIPSLVFGINYPQYYKETTIILTQEAASTSGGGGSSPNNDGSDEGAITTPKNLDTPSPGDSSKPTDSNGTNTAPQFGADKLKQFLAGLASPKSAEDFVIAVIEFLFSMLAFAAFIAFLVGGIQYMTSLGNEEKAATAKRTFVYAVIGLIISLSFVAILSIISGQLKEFFQ